MPSSERAAGESGSTGHIEQRVAAQERVGSIDGTIVRERGVEGSGRRSVGVVEGTAEGDAVAAGGVGVGAEERASGRGPTGTGSVRAGEEAGLPAGGGARGTVGEAGS